VWIVDRLEPMRQIIGYAALQAERGKVKKPQASGRRPTTTSGKLGPAPLLEGRHGLGWAAAYYACCSLASSSSRDLLGKSLVLVVNAYIIFLLVVDEENLNFGWVWSSLLFAFFFLSLGGTSLLQLPNPQRLYLLGVDYREQFMHRLRTFWATPSVLTTCVTVVVAVALGAKVPLGLLALAVGLMLFREGWLRWSMEWWPAEGARRVCYQMAWRSLVPVVILGLWGLYLAGGGRWWWLAGPDWANATRMQLFAVVCGACGVVGIACQWWWLDELT
jgi:hypothetical protein